jgi:hypothetical protein
MLNSAPCLAHYNPALDLVVHCDSSGYGTGCCLVQITEDGKEQPLAYASRTFTDVETRYSTTEKELLGLIYATRKFRCYLFGRSFVVKSDHHSLCWLKSMKDPTSRLARFAIKLQPFDFIVRYKNGKIHLDADCLSRLPVDKGTKKDEEEDNEVEMQFEINSINLSETKDMQQSDPWLAELYKKLMDKDLNPKDVKRISRYSVKVGIIYFQGPHDRVELLAIPEGLRELVLAENHDYPLAGHLGFAKTYGRIRQRYYWPTMQKDILEYCVTCQDCQGRKHPTQRSQGFLLPMTSERLWDRMGIDLLGLFVASEPYGHRYLIVASDHFSKFVFVKPIKTKETDEIAHFLLEDVICKVGC